MTKAVSLTIGTLLLLVLITWMIFFSTELKRQLFWAQQGNADAQVFIAQNYQQSKYPQERCQAYRWWKKAAEQQHPTAKKQLGNLLITTNPLPKCLVLSPEESHTYMLYATENGMYHGYAKLADQPEISEELRIQYLENGALHHDPEALYALASHYFRKNLPYSLHLLEEAAELGHAKAQTFLGDIYAGMTYTNKHIDFQKAVLWYSKAAAQKELIAQKNLGLLYLYGQGSHQNYDQAAYWLKQASLQHDKEAQLTLAMLVLFDHGLAIGNYGSANENFAIVENLAKEGYIEAQVELARLYLLGMSVPQNYVKAAEWFQVAANQSDRLAKYELGKLYQTGKGVPKNIQKAEELFYQARYTEYLDTSKPYGKAIIDEGYPSFKSY